MNNRTRHRGSALLMVVGLLAILLMLGTSFLLVSRLSRKESTALAIAAPLNPIAEGLMSEASAAILADLHISTNGFPYARANPGEECIDSPWVGDADENWLSPNNPTDKIDGGTNEDDYRFTRLGSFTPIENEEPNATTQYVHVDTDGDGVDDAYLFETGQVDITGRKYYGAIRIVDLSAYINVNVASESVSTSQDLGHIADGDTNPTYPDFYCPTLMNLKGFIPTKYADLNGARTPQTITSPYNILNNISLCLLDPGTGYTPFAITDELSLRWLGNKDNQRSLTGPLWEKIGDLDDSKTAQLTTYSVSRSLTRRMGSLALPTLRLLLNASLVPTGEATDTYNNSELSSLKDYLANETNVQTLYELLNTLTGDATLAGHVTANMVAFTQGPDYQKAYAFAAGDTTYYGAQPDLVISEAYAAHVAPLTTGTGDDAETAPGYVGYAIELFNPTGQSIRLSNYSLGKQGEATYTQIPGDKTIAANGRQVIYYFDVQPDENGDELSDAEKLDLKKRIFDVAGNTNPFTDDWVEMPVVDFRVGGLTLYRTAESKTIQVDEVTREDLDYTSLSSGFPAATTSADEESKDARRDDNKDRARYNVAKYKQTSGGNSFTNKLDRSNAVSATDLSDVYEGFAVPTKDDRDLYSLADLMESIYTIGPASTDTAGTTDVFTKQLAGIASQPLRGKADFATGTTYSLGGVNVPWPAMLGDFIEVVPPDFYRRDEIVGEVLAELKEYPSRVYGRININTASKKVLEQLPWPATLDINCDESNALTLNREALAQLILDQRGEGEFFLTTGQVAKILVEYADGQIPDNAKKSTLYPTVRNELYRSIASSITVQSDTYAVFIMIGLGNEDEDGNPDPDNWRTTRRYFGVIDRSNCLTSEDTPATLMFSEILAQPK